MYSRAADARVDPFSFADALVLWGHVVEAGVDVEHEEQVTNGADHSNRGGKMLTVPLRSVPLCFH